ncbi:uncharacterized [Tachysurus ichikawai]
MGSNWGLISIICGVSVESQPKTSALAVEPSKPSRRNPPTTERFLLLFCRLSGYSVWYLNGWFRGHWRDSSSVFSPPLFHPDSLWSHLQRCTALASRVTHSMTSLNLLMQPSLWN